VILVPFAERESRGAAGWEAARRYTRVARRIPDVRAVQRASASILDIGSALDRRQLAERRPAERLRMLREATNQITRTANDAIQAYRRASATVHAELAIPDGDHDEARAMRLELEAGRSELLRVLELMSGRYSWADPWPSSSGAAEVRDGQ
jgi:hypothetical protein